jgi:hypothetical protein
MGMQKTRRNHYFKWLGTAWAAPLETEEKSIYFSESNGKVKLVMGRKISMKRP